MQHHQVYILKSIKALSIKAYVPAKRGQGGKWVKEVARGECTRTRCLRSRPADGDDLEADLPELRGVNEETTVKDESRLVHALVNFLPVDVEELLPLRGDDDSLSILASFHCAAADADLFLD